MVRTGFHVVGLFILAGVVLAMQSGGEMRNPSSPSSTLSDILGQNATVVAREQETLAGIPVTRVRGTVQGWPVRLELLSGIDPDFAQTYLADRRNRILSLYTETPAPYEGIPTEDLDCPSRFMPNITGTTVGRTNFTTYELFADADMNFGACSPTEARYRGYLLAGYCRAQETIVELQLFLPRSETGGAALLDRVRCP